MRILIAGTLLLSGLVLIIKNIDQTTPSIHNNTSLKLHQLWANDLNKIQQHKKLSSLFSQIKSVKITPLSPTAAEILKNTPVHPLENEQGYLLLDTLIDHFNTDDEFGLIIHYKFIELKTKNQVWELSRTIALKK